MAAKKCLICNCSFRGRVDARTCSVRCRKRLQLVRSSLAVPAAMPARVSTPSVSTPARRGGRTRKIIALVILGLFGAISLVMSSAPQRAAAATTDSDLNFQARLLTNTGAVVPDGNYNIDFKIYTADSTTGAVGTCTGSCVWEETRKNSNSQGVPVIDGYFSVNLGSVTAFSGINWDQQLYLTMNIGGVTTGASPTWDGEMQNSGHSIQITAVPYAFRAGAVAKTDGSGNIGTLSFGSVTNNPVITLPNETGTVCTTGSVCTGYAPASGSANYIQNTTSPQSANVDVQAATSGSVAATFEANVSGSGDILDLKDGSGNLVDSVASDGSVLFQSGSTTAFRVQNSSNNNVFSVDASGNIISLGKASTLTATVVLHNASGSGSITLTPANPSSSSYTITIPAETGTICTTAASAACTTAYSGSGGSGVNTVGTIDSQTKSSDGAVIASNNIYLQTADGSNPGLVSTGSQTIAGSKTLTGATTLVKPASGLDSTTAFQVQPAASTTPALDVDTTHSYVGIGTNAPGSALDVRGAGNFQNTSTQELVVQSGSFTKTLTVDTSNNEIGIGAAPSGSGAMLQVAGAENINTASTAAFQIQNSSTNIFQVDTSNVRVGIGTASAPIATLQVEKSTYTSNEVVINNGTTGTPPTYPNSWVPTFVVNSSETTASRPLFFGYSSGGAWASMLTAGACGSYSQMCLDMGTTNAATVLENVGTQLNIGGGNDGNFSTVVFGNTSTTSIQNGIIVGKSSSTNGSIVFGAAGGSNTVTLQLAANPTSSYVMQLPTAIASSNQCLAAGTVSGSNVPLTFANCSNGVTTVGTFSNTSIANGASISGTTITLGAADGSNPGLVTTGSQSFAGAKTFSGDTLISDSSSNAFKIQDTSSNQYFNVDTSGSTITTESSTLNLSNANSAHTINIGAGATGGGYSFPQNGVLDNFNRASLGSGWTNDPLGFGTSTLSISGSTVLGATSSDANDYYNASTYGPDSEVYATVSTLPTGGVDPASIGLRVDPAAHSAYILGYKPSVSQLQLSSDVGGSLTPLGYYSATLSAGDKIGLSAIGTTITVYWYHSGAWSVVGSVTDSSISSAGYLMAFIDSTNGGKLDDFGGGTVTGVPSTAQSISIGSTNGASALNLQAGTGNLNVSSGAAIFKTNTNAPNTFEIQNSTTNVMFNVDTTNNLVEIGYPTTDGVATQLVVDSYNGGSDPATSTNGAMYYNSSMNSFRCYQNGGWTNCITPLPVSVVLGSDVSNSTTTAANVTGLSFSLAANTKYYYKFVLLHQSAATSTGVGYGVTTPTSPTTNNWCVTDTDQLTSGTNGSNWVGSYCGTGDASTATTAVQTAATTREIVMEGYIQTSSNSGTLQLRMKSSTTAATTTKAGSWGILTPVQ